MSAAQRPRVLVLLVALGHDLRLERAAGLEPQPLVLVVEDHQVAEARREACAAVSNCSIRRASESWLRSWNVSARSYSRRAASSVVAGRRRRPGWRPSRRPRRCTGPRRRCRRPRPPRRDAGGLQQVVGGGRLVGQAGLLAGGLGERGVDSAGLYSSTSSGGALDDLRLGAPLAGGLVLVAASGSGTSQSGRDRQVVGILVDAGPGRRAP